MLKRVAPLVPLAFAALLAACAGTPAPQAPEAAHASPGPLARHFERNLELSADADVDAEPSEQAVEAMLDGHDYQLPTLADTILERGFELLGTPYRAGGGSARTGFDCSGFVSYLFREEAGIELPRSTRDMIRMDAPVVSRDELQPGDVLFFNDRGRGRVSHAGIYIGNGEFIHSSSRRSGGVRVDSLDDRYWKASYIQAKRVLHDSAGA